jgi:histidinol phosphatase-like PHP family hydrolase
MGATMPDASLVSLFHRAGGKYVTFGSDSHIPCDVGADLEVAAQVARAAGFSHVAAFFNKEPQLFPL